MRKINRPIFRILSVLLILILIAGCLPVLPISAAAKGLTLDQLMAKFPDGKYWNGGDPDSWTNTPCTHHGNCPYNGSCGCNSFMGMSIQCMGFAEKLGYDATGYNPRLNANGWYTYTSVSALNNLKPGDIVRRNGHSMYVIGVEGETVIYGDCNSRNRSCNIRWGGVTTKSNLRNYFEHVRSAPFPLVSGYLGSCEAYPSGGTVVPAGETILKTYPCHENVDGDSQDVTAVTSGMELTVTGLYENSVGEYWYETVWDGTVCYIPASSTADFLPMESTVSITDVSAPANTRYGSGFPIKGNITSDGLPLSHVGAYIFAGTAVSETPYMTSEDTAVDSLTYSIYGSTVDNNLTFGRLPQGDYTYLVTATVTNYYIADGELVTDQHITRLQQNTFTVSASLPCSHTYTAQETWDATCGDDGYTTYVCSKCSFAYTQTAFASGDHVMGDWNVVQEPTCTEVGYEIMNCQGCTLAYIHSLPATGHSEVEDAAVSPDCTNVGLTAGSHCEICGEITVAREEIPPLGHDFQSNIVAPTCTEQGYTTYACSLCGEIDEITDYVDAAGHDYVDGKCNVCGEAEPDYEKPAELPSGDAELKFTAASLTLGADLKVTFTVNQATVDAYENVYAVFNFGDQEISVTDYTVSDGKCYFALPGIAPRMMNDQINAKLYGTFEGKEHVFAYSYTASKYCYQVLKYYESNTKLCTLAVDLLNFAAAHQKYMNYNMENPVNAELTDAQKAMGNSGEQTFTSVMGQTGENMNATFSGVTLTLSDAVIVRYTVKCNDLTGITLKITVEGTEYIIPASEFIAAGSGTYYVNFTQLKARQMRETIEATVCQNGEATSKTLSFSVESYAAKTTGDADLAALVQAMMYYGDSAKAFLG